MITIKRTITIPLDPSLYADLAARIGRAKDHIDSLENEKKDEVKRLNEAIENAEEQRDDLIEQLRGGARKDIEVTIVEDPRRPGTVLETRKDTGETTERAGTVEELVKLRQLGLPLDQAPAVADSSTSNEGEKSAVPAQRDWASCDEPACEGEDKACGWEGLMTELVFADGSNHCPRCNSTWVRVNLPNPDAPDAPEMAVVNECSPAVPLTPTGHAPIPQAALRRLFPEEHQASCPDAEIQRQPSEDVENPFGGPDDDRISLKCFTCSATHLVLREVYGMAQAEADAQAETLLPNDDAVIRCRGCEVTKELALDSGRAFFEEDPEGPVCGSCREEDQSAKARAEEIGNVTASEAKKKGGRRKKNGEAGAAS